VTSICATIVTATLYYAMAGFPRFGKRVNCIGGEMGDDHVPGSLRRGYTDLQKSPGMSVV
jgi:hypothetical protein